MSSLSIFSPAEANTTSASRLSSEALPIQLDATHRGTGRQAGRPECFRLEVPAAGFLMINITAPGTAAAEARLGLLDPAGPLAVIEQSASHLLVLAEAPQSLVACVGAQDPRLRLDDYKLTTAFGIVDSTPGPMGFDRSEPEPIEIEPEGIYIAGFDRSEPEPIEIEPEGIHLAGFDHSEPEPIEIEPEGIRLAGLDHSEPEPIEIEPEGIRLAGLDHSEPEPIEIEPEGLRFRQTLEGMCRVGELDDHADSFLCASPVAVGLETAGELRNAWGDDRDRFAFALDAPRTVRIETSGDIDTLGGLFDRDGQRLAVAADGGRDGNFRLVKTLSPGVYFVQVEAEGWTEGAYSLTVDDVDGVW